MDKADIQLFLKNVWFFLFYFVLLLLIASFGTVAEAAVFKV
jgi:hypothetical protein